MIEGPHRNPTGREAVLSTALVAATAYLAQALPWAEWLNALCATVVFFFVATVCILLTEGP